MAEGIESGPGDWQARRVEEPRDPEHLLETRADLPPENEDARSVRVAYIAGVEANPVEHHLRDLGIEVLRDNTSVPEFEGAAEELPQEELVRTHVQLGITLPENPENQLLMDRYGIKPVDWVILPEDLDARQISLAMTAAKFWRRVTVTSREDALIGIGSELKGHGAISRESRRELAIDTYYAAAGALRLPQDIDVDPLAPVYVNRRMYSSVAVKDGVRDFSEVFRQHGGEVVSTGGTLKEVAAGVPDVIPLERWAQHLPTDLAFAAKGQQPDLELAVAKDAPPDRHFSLVYVNPHPTSEKLDHAAFGLAVIAAENPERTVVLTSPEDLPRMRRDLELGITQAASYLYARRARKAAADYAARAAALIEIGQA